MQVKQQNTSIIVDDSVMRVYLASPRAEGQYPGILFYSDIYQLGGPITRLADHLAGYGYVVAAPEIYHRQFPVGTVIEPDDLGRIQGNEAARKTSLAEFDRDISALFKFLAQHPSVASKQIGAMGFCIGGHLACRAALNELVLATVCVYPTGIHSGKLGRESADTLAKLEEIKGNILFIFGTLDPHIPEEGRQIIIATLQKYHINYQIEEYEASHTFMRDDGYRFDPVATDAAWSKITQFFDFD